MSLLKKLFGLGKAKEDVYPDIPEGMKGVFMKEIGMH
jgi:hypothetical protein